MSLYKYTKLENS